MKLTPCKGVLEGNAEVFYPFLASPRCGAKTRPGDPCRAPSIKGKKRCRMHGGRGSGAPMGVQNALKHGMHTRVMIEQKRTVRSFVRAFKDLQKFDSS